MKITTKQNETIENVYNIEFKKHVTNGVIAVVSFGDNQLTFIAVEDILAITIE